MADKKKYYIRMHGLLIEVSKELYTEYHYIDRQLKTLIEKDARNGVVSYNALDTSEASGEAMMPDRDTPSVEEQEIAEIMSKELRRCIALLTPPEQDLIHAIFYDEATEDEVGKMLGISQQAVSKRKERIIEKLRRLINK